MSTDNSSNSKEPPGSSLRDQSLDFSQFNISDGLDFSSNSSEIFNSKMSDANIGKANLPAYERLPNRDGKRSDEVSQPTTLLSFKPSVLGVDRAKKRLQAFCIQKKQLLAANSTSSPDAEYASNPEGSSKKVINTRFSDITDDVDKNKSSQKKTKKALSSYERRYVSFMDNEKLRRDEERKAEETKMALDMLGVPLGLVAAGTAVKGLTPKPMPTKAMPPMKNYLNPEEIISLLDGTSSLTPEKRKLLNLHNKNLTKSDNPGQIKNRNVFGRESYSRSNYRSETRKSRHYNGESDRSRSNRSSERYRDKYDKNKSSGGKQPIASAFEDLNPVEKVDTSAVIENPVKNVYIPDNPSNATNDIFRDDDSDVEKMDADVVKDDAKVPGKFLRDTFVPLIEKYESSDWKFSAKREFSISPLNSYVEDLQKSSSSETSVDLKKNTAGRTVYSPGMDSSRESSTLFPIYSATSQTSQDSSFIEASRDKILSLNKNNLPKVIEKSNFILEDVIESCQPKMHSSANCYRMTTTEPFIEYCENFVSCECKDKRQKSIDNLSSNVGTIRGQIPSGDMVERNLRSSQGWYPKTNIALTSNASFNLISCWETDDSLSNHELFQKNDTPKIITNDLLNFDSKSFSLDKKPIINYESSIDLNESANKISSPKINLPDIKSSDDSQTANSTLASEYEKFMEAVCPAIVNEYNSPTSNNTASDNKVSSEFEENKFLENKIEENKSEENKSEELSSNLVNSEIEPKQTISDQFDEFDVSTRINTSTKIIDINEDNPNNMTNEEDNTNLVDVNKWTTESESDGGKINKKHSNSKLDNKRKGHAKISSRRTKGKHKNSSKSQKQHSSSSENTSSSDDSVSDSSSSSTSSSTSSSSSSSSDSSMSSSESTDNSDDSSSSDSSYSSSDLSSSESSSSSIDNKTSKKKSKKIRLKKKYRKLSKSKRKKLLIVAKAKELAKKMKNKKKKKKLKAKLSQEKKKKTVDEENIQPHIEICNNGKSYNISKAILPEDTKKNKRKIVDSTNVNSKKRRKEYSSDESSSGSSSSSKSSTQSDEEAPENKNKRKASSSEDTSDYECDAKKNKKSVETETGKFDMDTLLNIKTEKTSDNEEAYLKSKKAELPSTRAPYRQEIISASELQNDFLQCSISSRTLDIKMESFKKINDDTVPNKSICEAEESIEQTIANEERLKKQFDSVENFMLTNSSQNDSEIGKFKKSNSSVESFPKRKERKTRWGLPSDTVSINSIEDQIKSENDLDRSVEIPVNKSEPMEDSRAADESNENKIYKIQTISLCGIAQNDTSYNDEENYEVDYDMYGKELANEDTFEETKSSPRKLSLDDRINMVLLGPDDSLIAIEEPKPNINNSQYVSPEKGILISSSRTMRADPRINRAKRVCFADGFLPGQDSDCENEVVVTPEKELLKNKKKHEKSSGGHAYPCPETWPDYHPRWDRLPPPPPPPGSPPPELYERIIAPPLSVININTTTQLRAQ